MTSLNDFFHMGGYAFYVWTSYGCVIAYLLFQWMMPWRRWRKYTNKQPSYSYQRIARNDSIIRNDA